MAGILPLVVTVDVARSVYMTEDILRKFRCLLYRTTLKLWFCVGIKPCSVNKSLPNSNSPDGIND